MASRLPEEPSEGDIDLGPATEREMQEAGLQITGLRTVAGMSGSASKFSGLFSSSDDSSSDEGEVDYEGDAGRDMTLQREEGEYEDESGSGSAATGRRRGPKRQSTTEAKQRTPLDDDEDDDEDAADLGNAIDAKLILGEGPFADPMEVNEDSSDEDELVEIRPRRTS